jgi:hypothetical protein
MAFTAGKEVSIAMPTIVKMDANDILKQQGTEEVKVFLNKAVKVEHVEHLDVKLAQQKLNRQFLIQGPRQIPQQQRDQKIR